MQIDRKEIYRYLGYRNIQPSPDVDARLDLCIQQVEKNLSLQHTWQQFDIVWHEDAMDIGPMHITSKNLQKNLKGCESVILLAATIGPGIDRLIKRAEMTSMLDASLYQAIGAAAVEAYVNEINADLLKQMEEKGLYGRPRYSPGYGDLPLTLQKDFSSILDMPKNTGIFLTDTCIMIPSKSVTALIGFARTKTNCILEGCEMCGNTECAFRR